VTVTPSVFPLVDSAWMISTSVASGTVTVKTSVPLLEGVEHG
jgi:hypothetical protein